jgi:diguanylate cyclase (GGDEF)-like protein
MNLSAKLAILLSWIILFMGSVSYYAIFRFQNDILEEEIRGQLQSLAVTHLDNLDRTLAERLDDVEALSVHPVFESGKPDPVQIQRSLEAFLRRYPQYVAASFFDLNRIKIAHAGQGTPDIGKQHPLNEYWPAVTAGRKLILNVSLSTSLRVPTIHLVTTVKNSQGVAWGVLVLRTPVSTLLELVGGVEDLKGPDPKYKVNIIDRSGLVLYSNFDSSAILKRTDPDFAAINAALPATAASGKPARQLLGGQVADLQTERILVVAREKGFGKFKGDGWMLKVEVATSDAFAPVLALKKRMAALLVAISVAGIAAVLAALWFAIVRPLRLLREGTLKLGSGELGATMPVRSADEIGRLTEAFNEMSRRLKMNEVRIQQLADHDVLTELPNRRLFSDRLRQALAVARRDGARLAVIFLDIDKFKPINDTLGHHIGDLLLKEVAKRIQVCLREADTAARMGGDEFVVLLPTVHADQDALLVAEKIRGALRRPFELAGNTLHVSSSVGIAIYPEHGGDDATLLKNADTAMYRAKEDGRNMVKLFQ